MGSTLATSPEASSYTYTSNTNSFSNSSSNLSQFSDSITCDSLSSRSQTSISRRFISYDNEKAIIYIQPNNNNNQDQSWKIKLIPMATHTNTTRQTLFSKLKLHKEDIHIVFGVCDSSLIDSGYKHKYYGSGYSITYCKGFKFHSFITSFNLSSKIMIKYDKTKRQISFWQNGIKNKRVINIQHHPLNEYAITIKSYNNKYNIQIL